MSTHLQSSRCTFTEENLLQEVRHERIGACYITYYGICDRFVDRG